MKFKSILATLLVLTIIGISVLFIVNAVIEKTFAQIKYYLAYDYQTGNQHNQLKTESSSKNENLDYFFGDSLFKYDSYKIDQNRVVYNGDLTKVKKTKTINQAIKVWKNDFQSKQLVLFKNQKARIKNLQVSVNPHDPNAPQLHANFILPIKAHNHITNTSIYTGNYYSFDEIASDNWVLPEMNFDLQPVLIYTKTAAENPGTYEYEIKVSFENETAEIESFSFTQTVNLFDFDVKGTSDYGTGLANDFGYDSMMFLSNAQNWILPSQKQNDFAFENPLKVGGGDISWQAWDYQKDHNSQRFLEPENQDFFINWQKNLNSDLNMSYGYTPDFGIHYLKYFLVNQEVDPNDENSIPILSGNQGKIKNILQNQNLSLKITFDVFDEYINFLIKSGFKKIYLPFSPRRETGLPFFYTSKTYPFNFGGPNDYTTPLPRLGIKGEWIDSNGNFTSDGKVFYNKFIPLVIQQLKDHMEQKYQSNEFILPSQERFKVLMSFDETKYEVDKYVCEMAASVDPDHIIGSHGYLGWEFQANLEDKKEVQERMINLLDEITIEQSGFVLKYGEKANQKVNQERQKLGKITRYYSTWKHYPAAFLGSSPAESFWAPIEGLKLGSNGYSRWELEGFKNNITKDQEETTNRLEPGDAYLIYPGNGDGPHYSLRLINYIESIKDVWKLKFIAQNGQANLVNQLLNQVKIVGNANQNTDYKWDLNFWNWEKINQFLQSNQQKTISQQTEIVKMLLYNYQ